MDWIGKRVASDRWGGGVVKAQRNGHFEVFVRFDNGLLLWIPTTDLNTQIATTPVPIGPTPPVDPVAPETERINRLRALEALKFGVVPPNVKKFIFGRSEEIRKVEAWMKSRSGGLIVNGNYGTGKTHFLNYIRELALDDGYAVSDCTLDPVEAPLFKPKTIYRSIVKNLQIREETNSFQKLVEAAMRSRDRASENIYVDILQHSSVDEPYFWRWIEGDDTIKTRHGYPTIPNETTASNIICSLLSAYSYFCKTQLGLKGLLLLFDEAESYDASNSKMQLERGINFIKGLKLTADGDPRLRSEKIGYFSGTVANEGEKTHLIYSGRNLVRYSYDGDTGLKIVFAFTPSPETRKLCNDLGISEHIELSRLGRDDKMEAFKAIKNLFADSRTDYSLAQTDLQYINSFCVDQIGSEIRSLVKGSIEAFELRECYPGTPIKELLR